MSIPNFGPRTLAAAVVTASLMGTLGIYLLTGGRWVPLFHSQDIPLAQIKNQLRNEHLPFHVRDGQVFVQPGQLDRLRARFSECTYWPETLPNSRIVADIESVLPTLLRDKRVLVQETDQVQFVWIDGGLEEVPAAQVGRIFETLVRVKHPQYILRVLDDQAHTLYEGGSEPTRCAYRFGRSLVTGIPARWGERGRDPRAIWFPGSRPDNFRSPVGYYGPGLFYLHHFDDQLITEKNDLLRQIAASNGKIVYEDRLPNLKGITPGKMERETLKIPISL